MPRWTVPGAGVVSVAIVCLGIGVPWLLQGQTSADADRIRRAAGFESSQGLAVWWATTLFLLLAVFAYTEAWRRDQDSSSAARGWRIVAMILLWLSFDHAAHVHVAATRLAGRLGVPEWLDPTVVLLAMAAVASAWSLWRQSGVHKPQLTTAAFLIVMGGAGVDAALSFAGAEPGLPSEAVETALEWTGLLWLAALLSGLAPPIDDDPVATHGPGHLLDPRRPSSL